jgi:hypothetical protein
VTEDCGRLNHFRVIATFPDFQVGAVRKSKTDPEQNFIGRKRRYINLLDTQIFTSIENRGGHFRRQDAPRKRNNFVYRCFNLLCSWHFHT